MLTSAIFIGLAAAACATAHPTNPEAESRQQTGLATVYSSCKVKGDVALTFVSSPPNQPSLLPLIPFRTTVLGFTCGFHLCFLLIIVLIYFQ
jgi:hypothetical protein